MSAVAKKSHEQVIRPPRVAGVFYPAERRALADMLGRLVIRHGPQEEAIAILVPHGGYVTAGAVAGAVYSRLKTPRVVVVCAPHHANEGKSSNIMTKGTWATPLGEISIDEGLAQAIQKTTPALVENAEAHLHEHGIEVHLPFLQTIGVERFVPILVGEEGGATARWLGEGIAQGIRQSGEDSVLLVASADLTHYEPHEVAKEKDALAMEHIVRLDEEGLIRSVRDVSISMCGAAAAAAVMTAAKGLGATHGVLVKYQTSAETSGDVDSVVGYGGLLIR